MTRQDEKQRLRRRLEEQSIEYAAQSRWEDAIEANQQILTLVEDPVVYNRLGKAFTETGNYREAQDAYQQTLRISPTNVIARKNLSRLDALMARGIEQAKPEKTMHNLVDMRLYITEAGKTTITSLVDVQPGPAIEMLAPGEKVEMQLDGNRIKMTDSDGSVIGHIEPKLGQRLNELINGGNQYLAAVVQCDPRQVRVIIREVYQHPEMRGRLSFPYKFTESAIFGYIPGLRYDYEVEELLEDDMIPDEPEDLDEDFSTPSTDDDEELGLDAIEKDIPDDEENDN